LSGLPKPIAPGTRGWMYPWELEWLYAQARFMEAVGVTGGILEVGSYCGLSASALGQAGDLTCVDTFKGGEDLPLEDTYEEFRATMVKMDLHPEVFGGDSRKVLPELVAAGMKFRLVFIDGSHIFDTVLRDISNGWSLLSQGGCMVVDDYIGSADVMEACREFGGFLHVNPDKSKMAYRYEAW
jgi:predicted O-methyltransferase YrrM